MSALGQKRTFCSATGMSALPPIAPDKGSVVVQSIFSDNSVRNRFREKIKNQSNCYGFYYKPSAPVSDPLFPETKKYPPHNHFCDLAYSDRKVHLNQFERVVGALGILCSIRPTRA